MLSKIAFIELLKHFKQFTISLLYFYRYVTGLSILTTFLMVLGYWQGSVLVKSVAEPKEVGNYDFIFLEGPLPNSDLLRVSFLQNITKLNLNIHRS